MKRHEKYMIKYEKSVNLLTRDFFYFAWNEKPVLQSEICNQLEEKNKSKVGLKPFNNEYQDRELNLTGEKTLKDMKRHKKTRKIHYKMRKDRVYIGNRLFYLAWNNHHCCQL